jgi:hypothetical protein
MNTADNIVMVLAAVLLLAVDWLAFHDILEPHTVRDWLMLAASILVFLHFGRTAWSRLAASR